MDNNKSAKKKMLQFQYLQLEVEEVELACFNGEKEIGEYIHKNYPEHYEIFYGKNLNNKKNPHDKAHEIKENENVDNDLFVVPKKNVNSPKDVKMLYRKIVEKTHPDKIQNNKYTNLFCEATEAYNENRIGKLLEIASELEISVGELSKVAEKALEQNIENLKNELHSLQQLFAWHWTHATTKSDKENLIRLIFANKGVNINEQKNDKD